MVQQIILSCEIFGTTNHDIEVSKILNDELLLKLTMNLLCSSNFRFVLQFHLTCPPHFRHREVPLGLPKAACRLPAHPLTLNKF